MPLLKLRLDEETIKDLIKEYDEEISGKTTEEQEIIFVKLPKVVQRALIRRDSKI